MYTLKPKIKPLIVNGKLYYDETCRAKSLIRLKKEIVNEFEDLKEPTKSIGYKLEYHRNHKKLQKRIDEITKKEEGVPFLLFIYEEGKKAEA